MPIAASRHYCHYWYYADDAISFSATPHWLISAIRRHAIDHITPPAFAAFIISRLSPLLSAEASFIDYAIDFIIEPIISLHIIIGHWLCRWLLILLPAGLVEAILLMLSYCFHTHCLMPPYASDSASAITLWLCLLALRYWYVYAMPAPVFIIALIARVWLIFLSFLGFHYLRHWLLLILLAFISLNIIEFSARLFASHFQHYIYAAATFHISPRHRIFSLMPLLPLRFFLLYASFQLLHAEPAID